MKSFLTLLKIEGKLSLRGVDGLLFGIGMPMGVLVLIGIVGGDAFVEGGSYTFIESAFASLLTVGICATAFMGIPLTVADYRDKKILKHYFVTPISPMKLLLVQVVICMLTSIVSSLLVSIVAIVGFGYSMQGNLIVFIGAYFLVMLSMYGIGMMMASLCHSIKTANVVTSFVYFPMLFLSGASIPFELFPRGVQTVANLLPLTHGIKLLKDISLDVQGDSMILSIVVLVAFVIIGYVVSIKKFKWM